MNRKDFIKKSLSFGIGLPLLSMLLTSCDDDSALVPSLQTDFSGKVIVIGAGAAGLSAGYLLNRLNIDFQIIEAASGFGGRVKRADDFVDFPIDIGAEWIHTSPSILADILDDPSVDASIDFITYNPQTFRTWNNGKLRSHNYARHFYSEYKFKRTTWYGFFEQHMVPQIADRIVYNQPIVRVDTSADGVVLTSSDNTTYTADKVILTIPIKVLQGDLVAFTPALPQATTNAIDSIFMGDGLKVFIEFRERFYPDILFIGGLLANLSNDSFVFYDAAFRKDSNRHVLGLFSINEDAGQYTQLGSDAAIFQKVLADLDEIFDGKASQHYVQHVVQNWSNEPYVQGAYSYTFENDQEDTVAALQEPVLGKLFFAGEALSIDNQATVHGACESGFDAVERALSS